MTKLRIGILDYNGLNKFVRGASKTSLKEVAMLKEEIKRAGAIPRIYRAEKCELYFYSSRSEVLYNNKRIIGCDALITRVARNVNIELEVSIVKQFQLNGINVLNRYLPITRAKNKLRTMQMLSDLGIPVPATIVVRKLEYLDSAIKQLGGYPVVLKTPFGSYGSGVVIIESRRSLHSSLDIIWRSAGSDILLIQEYIAEAAGTDFRVFVVGDRVVAAMQRTATGGDFRSNLHRGGVASVAELTPEEEAIAIASTKALGLDYAGVDILRSKNGPVVLEVNANPGFVGLQNVTGVNVAREIVDYAVESAKQHQLDLMLKKIEKKRTRRRSVKRMAREKAVFGV